MTIVLKILIPLSILAAQVEGVEGNILEGACGYIALYSDHVKGLDPDESEYTYLGADACSGSAFEGVALVHNPVLVYEEPHFGHLSDIAFEIKE